ncbi:MAG: M14 family metallopeptidase [Bradymonadia bacterium]
MRDNPNDVLSPYRSLDEVYDTISGLQGAVDVEQHEIGRSVEDRAIRAVRLSAGAASGRSVLVCANIHGVEFIAAEVALGILQRAADGHARILALLDEADLWVIPTLNPDGYNRTWRASGKGDLAALRKNANGVDLNRNFPRPREDRTSWWTFGGWRLGSDQVGNPFYRGQRALSEPETQALADLASRVDFSASANLHSTMGTLIQPCVRSLDVYRQYGRFVRAFQDGQDRWRYKRMANMWVDRFTGEQEDYQHHVHNTWSLCVEHYPLWSHWSRFLRSERLFWRFNPRQPARLIDNDIGGILGFFHAALNAPRPDQVSLTSLTYDDSGV